MLQEIILNLQSSEEITIVLWHQEESLNCVTEHNIIDGKIIASGSPNEVISDKKAKTHYFGDEFNITNSSMKNISR